MLVVKTTQDFDDGEDIDILNLSDGDPEEIPLQPIVILKDTQTRPSITPSKSFKSSKKLSYGSSSEDETESLVKDHRERTFWEKEERKNYWIAYEKKQQAAISDWLLHSRKLKEKQKNAKEMERLINCNIFDSVPKDIWHNAECFPAPTILQQKVLETPSFRA